MKKTLLLLAFCALALIGNAQITSSGGQVYISEDALSSYANPTICINPAFNYRTRSWVVRCYVGCTGSPDYEYLPGGQEFTLTFTAGEIDAYTTSGSETEQSVSACEQAVIAYLDAISLNASITFSH